jgi:hypothetical protein
MKGILVTAPVVIGLMLLAGKLLMPASPVEIAPNQIEAIANLHGEDWIVNRVDDIDTSHKQITISSPTRSRTFILDDSYKFFSDFAHETFRGKKEIRLIQANHRRDGISCQDDTLHWVDFE